MKSVVLFERINGQALAGKDYERHMDGFLRQTWTERALDEPLTPNDPSHRHPFYSTKSASTYHVCEAVLQIQLWSLLACIMDGE